MIIVMMIVIRIVGDDNIDNDDDNDYVDSNDGDDR